MGLTKFPVQLTSFIGREREIADIKRLLFTSHLVTLTGAGGSGKTRLAIQIANLLNEKFTDGVWLVDLVPLREPAFVPQLVAQVFGLKPSDDQPLLETLQSFVHSKKMLLILDNCEHLKEACGQLAQALLLQAPELRILATSREPLAFTGESTYPVSGLIWPIATPNLENNPQDLIQYDAVRLFVERAQATSPNFKLTLENARATVETCRRLDGLPLALELASARVNVLTVQEIAVRLDNRFNLLVSAQRSGLEPRHQTLGAAIDWSYALLTVDEQAMLRRMAVFEAGCTLDSAESVCSGENIALQDILNLITSLVSKSLMMTETVGRTQARFRLLETIREYALEKLETAGETARLRDRHLNHYLSRAENAAPKLNESYQQVWLNWLESEIENLRAALTWALDSKQIESGLRLAIAIIRFWEIRGYVQEGMSWFERLLRQVDDTTSPILRANAFSRAAFMAMFLNDAATTTAYGQAAVAAAESAGEVDKEILIIALGAFSSGARVSRDFLTAHVIGERMIQLLRETPPQPFILCMTLVTMGSVAIELGDFEAARAYLDEGLELAQADGDPFRTAMLLNVMGDLARCEKKYAKALTFYERSEILLRELNAQRDLASILRNLGHTCLRLGNIERAYILFRESMDIQQTVVNIPEGAECLIGFAAIAIVQKIPTAGARLLGASGAVTGKRINVATCWRATRMEYERYLDLARAGLSEPEFGAEHAIGQAMSLDQAMAYAKNLPLLSGKSLPTMQIQDGLTGREREVAVLIGQGKTNGEIAAELVLSKRTVETHVRKIFIKLGLTNRGQIMRWARTHGLA